MLTRVSTLAAAAALLALNSLACRAQSKADAPAPSPTPASQAVTHPSLTDEDIARIRNLVFADLTLAEFIGDAKDGRFDPQAEPDRFLLQAVEEIRRGRPAEAKGTLKRVLALPRLETRLRLVIWNTLRGLGERPSPGEIRRVQGVVCELHNEAGVGTLAVYADGSVRWVGGQGKVTLIDSPTGDADLDSLVRDLLKASETVVGMSPALEKRRPGQPPLEHFRVTVLTFGGIHAAEVYGPNIDQPGHFAAPILYASARLAGEAIPAFEKKHTGTPPPPGNER